MKLLITGATGFLGKRIVDLLKKEGGHELYSLVRSESSASASHKLGLQPILADLGDPLSLKKALEGIKLDSIIHLAAEIATQRNERLLWKVNHEGTKNLFESVANLGLKRFIFASTVVVGEANGELLSEDKPLNVETEYGRTKQASERMLLEAYKTKDFPAIILRPSHIYGPGGWFQDLIRDIKIGLFRIPGNGLNYWDVVYVDDVAAAFLKVLHSGKPGEIYHIADDTPVTMRDFFNEAGTYLGKKKIGHAPVFVANLLKGKDPVRAATRSARNSNLKLKSLGWKPAYTDYKSGLKETFQNSN
ncbi:3-beta hydroxysteroid dehydrogenase/isomerase family protein [Leptospira inadai serovar Lyme str. 10]|uniref:3-beta hydroxysteroid dehydrogenase/isomerase family protein n=2 Tax=Leptospira inadai serovar Lyme TaxID=293084 RepID=V6H974_9LEPT|nr:NAD-dependent epimerase/dehydratase family protein [Leptospira inadai]EQA35641.1 3-beta hydroxysteroid dehydrogenase/isomerase family protein [Leptospira inadai serovar Lyme str. 10]PNV73666.1 epimerase [Leptospira inadai serovar Lyme]